jgi:hypothetical protein
MEGLETAAIGDKPDLVVRLITTIGDAAAGETTTHFWVRGAHVDRELRVIHTPELLPGDGSGYPRRVN